MHKPYPNKGWDGSAIRPESLTSSDAVAEESTRVGNVEYIKLDNTTFEVETNYIGKYSLLDIVKNAIKQDIESGNY